MLKLRASGERGRGQMDWLQSWFTFSFDQYRDPAHMHWSVLRVINEDIIAPGMGFGMHPHRDMEIISFVISGALRHQDSLGNTGILRPGEIQRMTAGSGITHSEFNPDTKTPTHMLQIWIMPSEKDRAPSWEQINWRELAPQPNEMRLLASPDGRHRSSAIGQDVTLWHGELSAGQTITITMAPDRKGWLQIAEGKLDIQTSGQSPISCAAGDGVAVSGESSLTVKASAAVSLLWFDMP
jgi:redox-sensitive bicupin YhaK (pirin superfamily)